MKKEAAEVRFWRHVKKDISQGGCWNWTGGLDKNGYGKSWLDGKEIRAHRLAYKLYKGYIPDKFCVLHSCDNPPCVNPNHLWLGTVFDNNLDKTKKGRNGAPRGEDSATSKLTSRDVKKIRRMYRSGKYTQKEIGELFFVSHTNIHNIVQNKTWPDKSVNPRDMLRKLTWEKVAEIRRLFSIENYTCQSLGKAFGVTPENIKFIINNKTWKI